MAWSNFAAPLDGSRSILPAELGDLWDNFADLLLDAGGDWSLNSTAMTAIRDSGLITAATVVDITAGGQFSGDLAYAMLNTLFAPADFVTAGADEGVDETGVDELFGDGSVNPAILPGIEVTAVWNILRRALINGPAGVFDDGLDGMLCLLPDEGATIPGGSLCHTWPQNTARRRYVAGTPGATEDVTLRISGVFETAYYDDGTDVDLDGTDEYYNVGGSYGEQGGNNRYRLEVSNPAAIFNLNPRPHELANELRAHDYQMTIPIHDGATVRLVADSVDEVEIRNIDDLESSGVPEISQPYAGQHIAVHLP